MVSSLTSSRSTSMNSGIALSSYLNSPCLRPCCCLLGFCFFSLILPCFDNCSFSSYAISPPFYSSTKNYYEPGDNCEKTKRREDTGSLTRKTLLFTPYSFVRRKVDAAFHSPFHLSNRKISFLSWKESLSWKCECSNVAINATKKKVNDNIGVIQTGNNIPGLSMEHELKDFKKLKDDRNDFIEHKNDIVKKMVNHDEGRRHHEKASANFSVENIVLYSDESIIVVNKPPGMLCVPGVFIKDSIATRVADHFNIKDRARMVAHRLDQLTSGVLVFARNIEALRHLHKQFAEKTVVKKYVALVHGIVQDSEGEIRFPIRKDIENPPKQIIDYDKGKEAFTYYKIRDTEHRNMEKNRTLVDLYPHTGRTHQLRIHLATLGHPIYGDDLYASKEVQRKTPRLCLHAERLTFKHPDTGKEITFDVPHPFDIDV